MIMERKSLIDRVREARIQQAPPFPAIDEESINYILSAVHELPVSSLNFVAGGTPRVGELWRVGKSEALLVWVRRVFNDGTVDVIPVVMDVELADEESMLMPSEATPLQCELAAMTALRTHLTLDVFLNFVWALHIEDDIEEVIRATRDGRPVEGVRVGPAILDDADRRIEYRCAIRDILAELLPGTVG